MCEILMIHNNVAALKAHTNHEQVNRHRFEQVQVAELHRLERDQVAELHRLELHQVAELHRLELDQVAELHRLEQVQVMGLPVLARPTNSMISYPLACELARVSVVTWCESV